MFRLRLSAVWQNKFKTLLRSTELLPQQQHSYSLRLWVVQFHVSVATICSLAE
jgi:hypothetical protein